MRFIHCLLNYFFGHFKDCILNNSRTITTSQQQVHERLAEVVNKHITCAYQKPIQPHNIKAFNVLIAAIDQGGYSQLILDSCCGTGFSTVTLAKTNPKALVVGVDQSEKRLMKEADYLQQLPTNCLLLRANCEDFWRLCIQHNIVFEKHFILYPNPYPKTAHLSRRWHGHPSFPCLKLLSRSIELRTNWKIYAEEFSIAWSLLTGGRLQLQLLEVKQSITLFEKKYAESGQQLWAIASGEVAVC